MGHLGASWLERPKREQEERTDLLVQGLDLKQTDIIADIGAGSGYFSFRIAKLVPQGKVFAVDISPQMIGIVRSKMAKEKITNVIPIQSTIKQTKLPPNSVDAALIVDAYHEFSLPVLSSGVPARRHLSVPSLLRFLYPCKIFLYRLLWHLRKYMFDFCLQQRDVNL